MTEDLKSLDYDDDAAIAYIIKHLPQDVKSTIVDDDIQYILDLIFDFYESRNLLDDESNEEIDIAEAEIVEHVLKAVKRDNMDVQKFTEENIQEVLDAEYEYSKSLGVY